MSMLVGFFRSSFAMQQITRWAIGVWLIVFASAIMFATAEMAVSVPLAEGQYQRLLRALGFGLIWMTFSALQRKSTLTGCWHRWLSSLSAQVWRPQLRGLSAGWVWA